MMDFEFQAAILAAWAEPSRHTVLGAAMAAMATHVRAAWHLGRLQVRAFERDTHDLTTLADSAPEPAEKLSCREDMADKLARWAEQGRIVARGEAESREPLLARLMPPGPQDCLVGGLLGAHGARGLLIAAAADARHFDERDRARFKALLEPYAAALDSHEHLRELETLRDAAEAESERLRTRLGNGPGLDDLIGTDGGLKGVFDRISLVAKSDVPVLILGETGAGKEMVAREIHHRSRRREAPFIRVNCGAIAPELIDSELCGHERGSFTGATSQRRGWFERADRGTLLLDEVGDLPPAAQVRLLRVLQDGLIRRVGGEQDVKVEVRIIAATHRDLPLLIQDGEFREDLWYRLATFPIVLPPLRERPGDIPALAAHFARRAATRFGLRAQLPTPTDLALLVAYEWPGNVRELAAVMDRAAILGDGQRLDIATALGASDSPLPRLATPRERGVVVRDANGVIATLDEAMRAHIELALSRSHGRIEGPRGAARMLAINPHTLRARMRKLGVAHQQFRHADA